MKLIKNDEIKVVTGKDKGKTGKVEKVFAKEQTVLVAGVNQFKRHMKAREQGKQSEIITITKPLSVAKVQLICPKCKKITRVGYMTQKDKKVRICKKCNAAI